MVVSEENKFVFVCIAKAASTSIRRRFNFFKDPPPEIYHMFLKDILLNKPTAKEYFKFSFVRNPYDRLYSSYADFKYSLGHNWAAPIKQKKTFKEFVMDLPKSDYRNFIHLQPQIDYITIDGKIGLDFVGRFENLQEDFKKVEELLGIPHKPLTKERYSPKVQADPKIYDQQMLEVVRDIYKQDFEELGYEK